MSLQAIPPSATTIKAPVATPVFVRLSDGANPIPTLPVAATGAAAAAAAPSGNPVLVAGSDGALVRTLLVTGGGASYVQPAQVAGSAATTESMQVAGSDGTTRRTVSTNASGHVNVVNAGTFGIQDSEKLVDNAVFTDGTTKVQPIGAIFDEVAGTALTENDIAAPRLNLNRSLTHVVEDGATRGRYATVSAANALKVDGSAVTQPVSGSITATSPTDITATGAISAGAGFGPISVGVMNATSPAANSSVSLNVTAGQTAVIVTVTGTYTITWAIEGTNDGTNWFTLPGTVPGSGVASFWTTQQDVRVNSAGCSQVRVRSTVYTSGTANFTLRASAGLNAVSITDPLPAFPTSVGQKTMAGSLAVTLANDQSAVPISGTVTASNTAGDVASGSADSGNPVKVGGVARSADITNLTAGNRANAMMDLQGRQVVFPYSLPENLVDGITAAITGTADTAVIAAQAAGVRTYITALSVINSHATVGTVVEIKDGTTVRWRVYAAAAGGGEALPLPSPLRGTAATAWNAACVTAGANVYVSLAGFKSNE